MDTSNKDIFISYKKRWFRDLKEMRCNVYFSSNEERARKFPEAAKVEQSTRKREGIKWII